MRLPQPRRELLDLGGGVAVDALHDIDQVVVGVDDVHFHDIRAKALSDAKRAGLALAAIQDSAGHASITTTEGYLRGFDRRRADLGLTLPKVSKTGK